MITTDYSVDLETLGNRFDAPILSIGVAGFNRHSGEIGKVFYREIKLESALQYGVVTASTLQWWMGQSDDAKRVFKDSDSKVTLPMALLDLAKWLPPGALVWGNGATFDITILEHAHARIGKPAPWDFWNVRDVRTAVDFAGYRKGQIPFDGVAHRACDDAIHQAKIIACCFSMIARKPAAAVTAPVTQPAATEGEDDLL